MFQDAKEELKRLEAELLAEEMPEDNGQEAFLSEETVEELLEDSRVAEGGAVYSNYSNAYGKNLRNYASGYKAYNADKTDQDLESYSEAVREPKRSGGTAVLVALALLLTAAVVGVLLWWLVRFGGVI